MVIQRLRLDLHTHIYEATSCREPTKYLVEELIALARQKGLDGMAITEHWDLNYGIKICEIKESFFSNDEFLIIPGREIEIGRSHVVELIFPGNIMFNFLAHPGQSPAIPKGIKGIEIQNGMHTLMTNRVSKLAGECGLAVLANSDAHYLEDIGRYSTEVFRDVYQNKWSISGADEAKISIG